RARSAVLLPPLVLSSSLFFFATTNFAVWASSGMYAHDLHGLIHCYVAALPFLQNTVIGDMFWATLLFGSWWSAKFLFAPARAGGGGSPGGGGRGVGAEASAAAFSTSGKRGRAASPQARPQIARGLLELGGKRCRRIVLRQPQADAGDAAARHPMRHQRDRPERHDVALLRPALDFVGEVIGERHLGGVRRNRQPVDVGQRTERDVAGHEEIAEQARIGRGRRRHVDEEAVERLRLLRRRQDVDIVARPHRLGLQRAQDLLLAHHQRRPRPGRQQAALEIGAVGG